MTPQCHPMPRRFAAASVLALTVCGGSGGGEPPDLCGIEDADTPSVSVRGYPETDAALVYECGAQGSVMVVLDFAIAGVDTGGADEVPFAITLDVPGLPAYEDGHFATRTYDIYVGCDGADPASGVFFIMPDGLTDPALLTGQAVTVEVVMMPGTSQETRRTITGTFTSGDDWCYAL